MDYTTTCPGCGREITIPPDLDSCFCTYCGGKVERPAAPPPETSSFRPAAFGADGDGPPEGVRQIGV